MARRAMDSQHHQQAPYLTLVSRGPRGDGASMSSADSAYGSGAGDSSGAPSATHDISRVNYHVKHLEMFAKSLEDSASRAFPNRGRSLQRYTKVQVLLLHWMSDDLFVLPELEDLEQCMREDYGYETDVFAIPSENSHLELMLKVGALIKEHEATDTLFIVYYGGHARIDESRQSTWCATRHSASPWLQWSAIQTLLERSMSDTLILLDCCAGAASATFPNGKSITETISASSWDAIAPDPGRYSFTNALIEVLQQWKLRTYSAAMLHAEVLARLKHPRPITINGKHFEARSTPVHFMMTSNHKAPSIELGRIIPDSRRPPSPPEEANTTMPLPMAPIGTGRGPGEVVNTEPTEDKPHVMISLALEDNQQLDLDAWEQWLASFPALARHVKVQGVFKSHSTLLLLSLPVMIWDLLPEDPACSFVAFIRSNNLIKNTSSEPPMVAETTATARHVDEIGGDGGSIFSGTTLEPETVPLAQSGGDRPQNAHDPTVARAAESSMTARVYSSTSGHSAISPSPSIDDRIEEDKDHNGRWTAIVNHSKSQKWPVFQSDNTVPEPPKLSQHVAARLEEYFQQDPDPNVAVTEIYASNLGIRTADVNLWYYHRHQQERTAHSLRDLGGDDSTRDLHDSARMILPGHLNRLLEIYPSNILLIDLRPHSDFEKAHIHQAANLRVPCVFIQHSPMDMIERAFADEGSRRSFAEWSSTKCIVFYDRAVEFTWECPTADALLERFRQRGWMGKGFVLKGPFREFSVSYDKYIVGAKTSKPAQEYLDSLEKSTPLTPEQVVDAQQQYDEWLQMVDNEAQVPSTNLVPAKQAVRLRSIEEAQENLLTEFKKCFPDVYYQSLGQQPPPAPGTASWDGDKKRDNFDVSQGPLVGPLSRAMEKMREAGVAPPPGPDYMGSSFSGKMAGDEYHQQPQHQQQPPHQSQHKHKQVAGEEDYDEIGPKGERLRDDPGFQSTGDVGSPSPGAVSEGGGGVASGEGQKKQRPQQPRFLRSARSWIRGTRSS
ncbi:hypothetical protein RB601_001715 [Gaeumannomyces tritici]